MIISYNWLKSYIPEIPSVDKVSNLITFHICEIEDIKKLDNGDFIFDIKILPDRAHDLLSHQGIAREIASLLGITFKEAEYKLPSTFSKTNLEIITEDKDCNRYIGRIIRNVKIGPSPDWIVKYLESVGQRSINNIVDATNIIMLDTGQPIHAFDLEKIDREKIVIKSAKKDESITIVGSEKITIKLEESDIVINDGVKNLAIAGVKGGIDSGVSEETKDILIEVANFDYIRVRKTARRLGIHTDASKRYENNLSTLICKNAMDQITSLIFEMFPEAIYEEKIDIYNNKQVARNISFSSEYISKILGLKIPDDEIKKILNNYNYEFSKKSDTWEVVVPFMRFDIVGPQDMVEEIGRVYGYDKITPTIPEINFKSKDNSTWIKISFTKYKLIQDNYREVFTSSFTNKGEVEILASASDKNYLRTELLTGLDKSYKTNKLNAPLFDNEEIKIFEIGSVFSNKGEEVNVAYKDKKNKKEIKLDEFISLHKEEFSNFRFDTLAQDKLANNTFRAWSIYPFIIRDIAVWVDAKNDEKKMTNKAKLVKIYKEFSGEILNREPILFDEFTKEGRTSYGYRLIFQDNNRTLTDQEINIIMEKIYKKIKVLKFEVR